MVLVAWIQLENDHLLILSASNDRLLVGHPRRCSRGVAHRLPELFPVTPERKHDLDGDQGDNYDFHVVRRLLIQAFGQGKSGFFSACSITREKRSSKGKK